MTERAYWVAWSQVAGVGPILLKRLHQQFGDLQTAWEASPADWMAVDGIGLMGANAINEARSGLVPARILTDHEARYPHFWTPADAEYPRLLWEIADPPPVLYYRGQPDVRENQGLISSIAIVGTRDPSDYGRRWTRRITQQLVDQDFTVVSGLASGVDTEAHQACLRRQGRTIAVLGTGVDLVYPLSNRLLYQQVLETGLVVSEYPDGTPPDRVNFPRRNRIIAGLSRAVIVAEAPLKSGALITARLANEYGRDVYVLPGSLDNPKSLGCLNLLNQGAQVILGAEALLETLSTMPRLAGLEPRDRPSVTPPPQLTPDLALVLAAIALEPISLDRLTQTVALPTGGILSALTQLELMGLVLELPGKHYQRV